MAVSNKKLSRWYRELSQQLRAGFPLPRALESAGGIPIRDRRRFAERLRAGEPVDSVLAAAPRWMPEVDRFVLSSAAQSGRLSETLLVLSEQHAHAGRQAARALSGAIYPLFLVHFAILVLPLQLLIMESVSAYLRAVMPLLIPLWLVLGVVAWAAMRRHRWLGFLMRWIPLLRGYLKNRAIADLTLTLRAYLVAGETISVAWFGAARACGDRGLRKLGMKIAEEAQRGISPGEQLNGVRRLPEEFIALYQSGELSGQLDENLDHLWEMYSERATAKLLSASFWYPKVLLILVALLVAWMIIRAYLAQLGSYMNLLE